MLGKPVCRSAIRPSLEQMRMSKSKMVCMKEKRKRKVKILQGMK